MQTLTPSEQLAVFDPQLIVSDSILTFVSSPSFWGSAMQILSLLIDIRTSKSPICKTVEESIFL
jgi:hypothetical protein